MVFTPSMEKTDHIHRRRWFLSTSFITQRNISHRVATSLCELLTFLMYYLQIPEIPRYPNKQIQFDGFHQLSLLDCTCYPSIHAYVRNTYSIVSRGIENHDNPGSSRHKLHPFPNLSNDRRNYKKKRDHEAPQISPQPFASSSNGPPNEPHLGALPSPGSGRQTHSLTQPGTSSFE